MSEETATLPSTAGANNENSNTGEASAASEWKAYVPSGDQRLVLSAIDNQLNAAKAAWKERNATADKDGNKPNNNVVKEKFFMGCIDDLGASLKRQLEAVTIPADETEVERALDSFKRELIATGHHPNFEDTGNNSNDDEESLSSVDDENEEIEFDDNDIVDQDAYNQVKLLRSQAREISSRVISIREETAGRALEMTRRGLEELMRVHGFTANCNAEEGGKDENGDQQLDEGDADIEKSRKTALNPMNIALQTLTSSLQSVDSNLVEKLESMKETIGTIDTSVEKYQRMSQGDTSALSQTEKALLLASEEPQGQQEETFTDDTMDENDMDPDKKLARLLAGVL